MLCRVGPGDAAVRHVHGHRAAQRSERHAHPRVPARGEVEAVVLHARARACAARVWHAVLEDDERGGGGGGDRVGGGALRGVHADEVGAAGGGAPAGVVGVDGERVLARRVRVPAEVRLRGQRAVRAHVQVRVAQARRHRDGEGGDENA